MKKFSFILVTLMLVFTLAACTGNGGNENADTGETVTDAPAGEAEVTQSGIYINEYSPNSTQTLMDDEGEFVAWVEIYNSTIYFKVLFF